MATRDRRSSQPQQNDIGCREKKKKKKQNSAVRFGDRSAVGDARADRDRETSQVLPGERKRDRHAVGVGKLNVGEALGLARALVEHELDVSHLAARAKVLKERHVVDLADRDKRERERGRKIMRHCQNKASK